MTIPVPPVNINPQVHKTEDPFLQALLQGTELGLRAQELQLNKDRLKAEQAAQKFEESKFSMLQGQLASMGPAIQQLLLQGGSETTVQVPSLPTAGAGIGQTLPMQFQADVSPWANAVRQVQPAALPQFLETAQPELKARREALLAQQQQARIEAAIGSLPEAKRGPLRHWFTLSQAGDLSPTMTAELFPELVQQGVDPARFTAALKAGTIFGPAVTFGLVRRQLGLPAMAGGIPDDLAFPDLLGPSGGAGGIDARKVKFYADQMAANNVILKELHDNNVRMTVKGQVFRDLITMRGGGLLTLAGRAAARALNTQLSSEERRLIQAQTAGSNAYRYLVSGQQTSDAEYAFIVEYLMESVGDDETTIQQKAAFRTLVEQSAREVIEGRRSGAASVANLRTQVQQLGIVPPEVARALQTLENQAKDFERRGGHSAQPLLVDPEADGNALDPAFMQEMRGIMEDIARNQRLQGLELIP